MGNKVKKSILPRMGVAIDPHRGVVYFDDISGRIKQFHNKGVKNIYSVVVSYSRGRSKGMKVIRMDYGNFNQAYGRFRIETGCEMQPDKMRIKEIRMSVSTFNGTKLVNEDTLRRVEYGTRKLPGMENRMIGEEMRI